jgi:hypothetical protein
MARAKYIYFIRDVKQHLVGTFTVKHEAHRWMIKTGRTFSHFELSRMKDGVQDKEEEVILWDEGYVKQQNEAVDHVFTNGQFLLEPKDGTPDGH